MAIGFTPKFTQEISLNNVSQKHFIVAAAETASLMGWQTLYTSKNGFIIYTNKGMFEANANIKIIYNNGNVSITSASSGSEMFDLGRNKSNVRKYIDQFEKLVNTFSTEEIETKYEALKENLNQDEDDILFKPEESFLSGLKSAFIPTQGYFVTPILAIINIFIFILMICNGVDFLAPSGESMLNWGANFKPLTLGGEEYRLFTNIFIHFGILHLLLNMYALIYIGVLLEPRIGRIRFLSAYLLSGILASVGSLWWNDLVVSGGASGAIFGMYGVFLGLLSTNVIDKTIKKQLLTSIGIFVAINLFYGATNKGIDNAAHIGGLISGFIIGLLYAPSLKKTSSVLKYGVIAVSLFLTIFVSYFTVSNTSNDLAAYQQKMDEFSKNEIQALELYQLDPSTPNYKILTLIKNVGIPAWQKNLKLLEETEGMSLSENIHETNKKLKKYCELRLECYNYIYKSIKEDTHAYDNHIKTINSEIEDFYQPK